MLGHNRPASETPFKWCFAGGPRMASGIKILPPSSSDKKMLSELDPLWQNYLDLRMQRDLIIHERVTTNTAPTFSLPCLFLIFTVSVNRWVLSSRFITPFILVSIILSLTSLWFLALSIINSFLFSTPAPLWPLTALLPFTVLISLPFTEVLSLSFIPKFLIFMSLFLSLLGTEYFNFIRWAFSKAGFSCFLKDCPIIPRFLSQNLISNRLN